MGTPWKEVARLGGQGARYPHILVDSHGWCLRLGANRAEDDKFYSSFPSLLEGLVEHILRRRLPNDRRAESIRELAGQVRDVLRVAAELGTEALKRGVRVRPLRLVGGS